MKTLLIITTITFAINHILKVNIQGDKLTLIMMQYGNGNMKTAIYGLSNLILWIEYFILAIMLIIKLI